MADDPRIAVAGGGVHKKILLVFVYQPRKPLLAGDSVNNFVERAVSDDCEQFGLG